MKKRLEGNNKYCIIEIIKTLSLLNKNTKNGFACKRDRLNQFHMRSEPESHPFGFLLKSLQWLFPLPRNILSQILCSIPHLIHVTSLSEPSLIHSKITSSVTFYLFAPLYFLYNGYHILKTQLVFVYLFIFHLPSRKSLFITVCNSISTSPIHANTHAAATLTHIHTGTPIQ